MRVAAEAAGAAGSKPRSSSSNALAHGIKINLVEYLTKLSDSVRYVVSTRHS